MKYNWTKQRIPACPLKQETINNITGNTRSLPYIHNSHCTIPISFVITSQWHGTGWTQQRGPDAILDTGRKNTWFYLFYFVNCVISLNLFITYCILDFSTFVNLNISRRSSSIDNGTIGHETGIQVSHATGLHKRNKWGPNKRQSAPASQLSS